MLKKFVWIKNVGTFRNHGAGGDITHRKLNLIHADNARGKSTLCAVLRSLRHGDPLRIMERKTIDSAEDPAVKLQTDSGFIEFKNKAWNGSADYIEIFDSEFISENVYSGDVVGHQHKCNLCRVVIGAEGVKLAKAIDDLDDEERTANNTLTSTRNNAERLIQKGSKLEDFISLEKDLEVDSKIEAKQEDIELMNHAEAIGRHQGVSPIRFPQLPGNFESMLAKTVDGISLDAANAVRRHIAEHIQTEHAPISAEEWLSLGLQIAKSKSCPLCAQPLDSSTVIESMRSYFSQAYRDFQGELAGFIQESRSTFSPAAMESIKRVIANNTESIVFWNIYADIGEDDLAFEGDIQTRVAKLHALIDALLSQKFAQPLEPIHLGSDFFTTLREVDAVRDRIEKYNAFIDAANQKIKAVKERAGKDTFEATRREISQLRAAKLRHEPATVETLLAFAKAQTKKTEIEVAKEEAKKKLNDYNAGVMAGYEERVNHLLLRMGASFRLRVEKKVNYTGGTPRVSYALEIRGKLVGLGNEKTPPGTPCFKNTLSMGDRSTLALAFFIAQIHKRADIADLVVVLDDPFTSLDEFRQHWTCVEIRRLAKLSKQVIVLSHSKYFLKKIVERGDSPTKVLQITTQAGPDSHIIEFDLEDASIEQFEKEVVQMRAFIEGGEHRLTGDNKVHTSGTGMPYAPHGAGSMSERQKELARNDLGGHFKGDRLGPARDIQEALRRLGVLVEYTDPFHHDSDSCPAINSEELKAQIASSIDGAGKADLS